MLLVGKDWKLNKGLGRLETGERREKKNRRVIPLPKATKVDSFSFSAVLVGVLTFFLLQMHIAWTVIDS